MGRPKTPNPGAICGIPKKQGEVGQPCELRAGFGTKHVGFGPCRKHGGTQKLVTAKYEAELARWEARKFLNTYGANSPITVDPLTAVRQELHRAAGIVAWLEEQVAGLDENEVTHLIVTNADKAEEDGRKLEVIDERANELIKLLQQERKMLVEICKVCLSYGIAQQELDLAKQQAIEFNQILRDILVGVGVDIKKPEVVAVVKQRLAIAAASRVNAAA